MDIFWNVSLELHVIFIKFDLIIVNSKKKNIILFPLTLFIL